MSRASGASDEAQEALAAWPDREPPLAIVARQIREVFAAETPCPGGHRNDGGYGDYDALWQSVMLENDIPDEIEDRSALAAQNLPRYKALSRIVRDRWIVAGACKLTIPTHEEWDGDGEWTSFCYPVADGPCAETMQLNDDWDGEFWAAYFAQERLRKAVEEILTRHEGRLPPLTVAAAELIPMEADTEARAQQHAAGAGEGV